VTTPALRPGIVTPAQVLGLMVVLIAVQTSPTSAQPRAPLASPRGLACAPRLAPDGWGPPGLVNGAPDDSIQQLFQVGDPVLVNMGRAEGVSVGTQFFTQRLEPVANPELRERGVALLRTTGWLRAVEIDEHAALAVIEQTCLDVRRGDHLVPFQWPEAVSAAATGTVSYDGAAATVLFGRDGRSMASAGQLLVIDHGADQEIAPGQRLSIFRAGTRASDDPVTIIGEAVAVLVSATSSTVHVTQATEPIRSGDRLAAHRAGP